MKPLDAREWLQFHRLTGCEFAGELLDLMDGEQEAEAKAEVLSDIGKHAPENIRNSSEHWRLAEWISDRFALLDELEKVIAENSEGITWPNGTKPHDPDDILKAMFTSSHWSKYDL